MKKHLYVSEYCKKMGYAPENDYDPRYYDYTDVSDEGMKEIDALGYKYELMYSEEWLYTEDQRLQEFMQDELLMVPIWFDATMAEESIAEHLTDEGYIW